MMPDEPARLCTKCPEEHVENCPDCFGFGLLASGAPVSAEEYFSKAVVPNPCSSCGGPGVCDAYEALQNTDPRHTPPVACRRCGRSETLHPRGGVFAAHARGTR